MRLLSLLLLATAAAAAVTASHHTCWPSPPSAVAGDPDPVPCPPFHSPPTVFPFAHSPGCGHPSFQIRCSSPYSLITINSHTFTILAQPRNNSLLLSPAAALSALPAAPINLSGTPFRPSAELCTRLSLLRPCLHSNSTSTSSPRSHWQHQLLSAPRLLLPACSAAAPRVRCESDVPAALARLLRSGILITWDPAADPYFTNCSACRAAVNGSCGFNDSAPSKPFLCFPSSAHLRRHAHTPAARLLILAAVLLAAAFFVILPLSLYAAAALRRRRDGDTAAAAFLSLHDLRPPVFTFDQLRSATAGFDPRRKIGDGGFGSVYLAHLPDGRAAAVKRLHRRHPAAASKAFCNEILILSTLRHPNLVRLHGYCCDPRGLLLVYDYVPNGTLADHLHGSCRRRALLSWAVRVDVALQTASALEYLHSALKSPVVHRDVTSANIFVERDMRIKVGDFGLCRLLSMPAGSSSEEYVCCTGPQGTPGYLDPDYHRSFRLTEKSDVYSFGVVLLELVTGMKAVDMKRERRDVALADLVVARIQLGQLKEVVDPALVEEGPSAVGTIEAVAELAFRCVAGDKDDRPDARELVEELRRIRGMVHAGRNDVC